MNDFQYYNPVTVEFRQDGLADAGAICSRYGKKAMLVSYEDVSFFRDKIELLERVLKESGVEVVEFFRICANPLISTAREGVRLCREEGIDIVVGFGGGSVMDSAKIIAAGTLYEHGDIANMFVFSHSDPGEIPPERSLPTVMISTLPATGSEMNLCAVMTDDETKRKSYVWAEAIYPKVAILDPSLTVGLPRYQTACGGIDTMAHIIEAYLNGSAGNLILQDYVQEGAIRAVMETLPVVLEHPDDLQARGVMMWAATMALSGFINAGTMVFTPMHQLGHVLSARYNATHGATLACLMPAWMRFFARRSDNRRYRQFAQRIWGCVDVEQAADRFEAFIREAGVETHISEFGVREEDIPMLADQVRAISFGPDDMLGSYPKVNVREVEEIYRLAL